MLTMEAKPFFDGINPDRPRYAVLDAVGAYVGCITERAGFAYRFTASDGLSHRLAAASVPMIGLGHAWRTMDAARCAISAL